MNNTNMAPSCGTLRVCLIAAAAIALLFLHSPALYAQHAKPARSAESLPNGMEITPLAARGATFQPLNPDLPDLPSFTVDHPASTALSPDGNTLLILTSGFNRNFDARGKAIPAQSSEYVFVFDLRGKAPVKQQVLRIPNSFVGLAWSPDSRQFFVSGGQDDSVHVFAAADGIWAESGKPIALEHKNGIGVPDNMEGKAEPVRPVVAGLAVSPDGKMLLAANYQNDSVSLVDLDSQKIVGELDLRPGKINPAQKGVPGGEYPYGVVFCGNDKAYVSSLRDREIVAVSLKAGSLTVAGRIKTHGQPGKMTVNRAGTLLFATADNSDTVVIVQTAANRIIAEIKTTAPAGGFSARAGFKGSMPNDLALSPDEKTLYVTNGGTNSVAVIALDKDLDDSHLLGLIPTGWYPTGISVGRDNGTLYVVNGKSNPGPDPKACRATFTTASDDRPCAAAGQYILQLEKGGFSVIPCPSVAELHALTQQVARNNHFLAPAPDPHSRQIFNFLRGKIRHVIYIVKENRSYDQVLGDLETGNGDPSLALFPDALTPNHHQLARQFVTLDNFYDSGEVSGIGWNWSTAARATDVVERTIPLNYAKRGLTYDVEGINRGLNLGAEAPHDRHTENLDDADALPGSADVAAPDGPEDESGAGYLWDAALRAGLTVRNYGFFVDLSPYAAAPGEKPAIPLLHDPFGNGTRVAVATKARLEGVTDPYFRGFDQRFPDYWRFKEWEREFDDFVAHDNLPSLELVRLPHDHFGLFKDAIDGVNTVETQISDNDYAVGLLVEKVAHSKYANSTLIFVIEDDSQNGPDHVDAHRSIAFIAGPWVKQHALITKRFNTVTLLRTMEEVLGLKPLGLYDAVQPGMAEVFSTRPQAWNFSARVPAVLRSSQLPLPALAPGAPAASPSPRHDATYWADHTRGFDFSAEDKLDSASFNLILWNGLKDEGQAYPEERDGRDLRHNRRTLLQEFNRQSTR